MKLPSLHRMALLLGACFLLSNPSVAQVKLTQRDKSQIIRFILQRYDFSETESCCDEAENTIYLLGQNISLVDIPSRKGLKFKIIEHDEIDRLGKAGVEYYRFSGFQTRKTSVRISFVRTFTSVSGGSFSVMEYTCQKIAGRWKLKARLDGVGST